MPGIEWPMAEITRRKDGTTDSNLKTRNIRKARSIANGPAEGSQEVVTINKSKTFQPDLKK